MDRRSLLLQSTGVLLGAWAMLGARSALGEELSDAGGRAASFSFDLLSQAMRAKAAESYEEPQSNLPEKLATLSYDEHRAIRYRPGHAVWKGKSPFELHAFHLGWLFEHPVRLHNVADGMARPLTFAPRDFEYRAPLDPLAFQGVSMPGVAGFRLHYPLNKPDTVDELVAFLGASYYRVLGRDTLYGLSARGLAINTATTQGEEFPRFTDFYLETPGEDSEEISLYAALDSPSLTGAYAFRIVPGQNTLVDVTARLFVRRDIERLGIAPLTSMFLFGENNSSAFDDYRDEVHDSDGLKVVRRNGDEIWRSLNNPSRVANSFFVEESPRGFGLFQRDRNFEHFSDGESGYERRPSLMVEPLNEWGKGLVHLVEIPSKLEINDNIVAYWVPDAAVTAGQEMEFRYRQTWGAIEETGKTIARVVGVRTGAGGVSGVPDNGEGLRKFVVDFEGEALREASADKGVEAQVSVSNAEIVHTTVSHIGPHDVWRLALDLRPADGEPVEMNAYLTSGGRSLSETWSYQWRQDDGKVS